MTLNFIFFYLKWTQKSQKDDNPCLYFYIITSLRIIVLQSPHLWGFYLQYQLQKKQKQNSLLVFCIKKIIPTSLVSLSPFFCSRVITWCHNLHKSSSELIIIRKQISLLSLLCIFQLHMMVIACILPPDEETITWIIIIIMIITSSQFHTSFSHSNCLKRRQNPIFPWKQERKKQNGETLCSSLL